MGLSRSTQIFEKPWFGSTPQNAKKASAQIGSGDNGTVTVKYDYVGTEGNSYELAVVIPDEASADLYVDLSDNVITVSLATDGDKAADDTKNTAILIAAEISKLTDFTATKSGTGATAISAATEENVVFEGGQYATPAKCACAIVISGTLYLTYKGGDKYTEDLWYSAALTQL